MAMESEKNSEGLSPEQHEIGILTKLLERAGARRMALAAALVGSTGACTHYSTSSTLEQRTGNINLSGQAYCDRVDYLTGRGEGSYDRRTVEGRNGRVVVTGVVENGQVVATVAVTTPDGRTQTINCN